MLVDLRKFGVTGHYMETKLDEVYITVNKNKIPFDTTSAKETSGIRVGTPAVTTRGFKEPEMVEIADLIYLTASDFDNKQDEIRARVEALCGRFPIYE